MLAQYWANVADGDNTKTTPHDFFIYTVSALSLSENNDRSGVLTPHTPLWQACETFTITDPPSTTFVLRFFEKIEISIPFLIPLTF